ncbi:hypothetical protein FGK60_16245 [Streptomyces sp. DASNCL29]|nr:hypothetical protein FGK60_16245 [Streptomyces sp. DASNCL29]
MASGAAAAILAGTLTEQLPEQLHGRFPLTETDPPVGQDKPSMHTPDGPDILTTSVTTRQFPSRADLPVR